MRRARPFFADRYRPNAFVQINVAPPGQTRLTTARAGQDQQFQDVMHERVLIRLHRFQHLGDFFDR
jgi:hypothetical protein